MQEENEENRISKYVVMWEVVEAKLVVILFRVSLSENQSSARTHITESLFVRE